MDRRKIDIIFLYYKVKLCLHTHTHTYIHKFLQLWRWQKNYLHPSTSLHTHFGLHLANTSGTLVRVTLLSPRWFAHFCPLHWQPGYDMSSLQTSTREMKTLAFNWRKETYLAAYPVPMKSSVMQLRVSEDKWVALKFIQFFLAISHVFGHAACSLYQPSRVPYRPYSLQYHPSLHTQAQTTESMRT